jgi:short-subunit dehydrogenase
VQSVGTPAWPVPLVTKPTVTEPPAGTVASQPSLVTVNWPPLPVLVSVLVNNAGASLHGPLMQVDPAEFSQNLQLNVASVLTMTQAVVPVMRQQGFGRIVNISSGTTRRVAVGVGAYASAKSAVNMLSAVLRQELAGDGIAESLLLPSVTATEFGDGMFTLGSSPRPGMVVHSPDYVASVVLRLLRTGEESFDIPHGPEQPGLAELVTG